MRAGSWHGRGGVGNERNGDCDWIGGVAWVLHGGRVRGGAAWGQWARVRVSLGPVPPTRGLRPPRSPFDFPQGERPHHPAGVAAAFTLRGPQGEGMPLLRAPGYRLSPVRRWGCAGRRVLMVSEGEVPLLRDGPFAKGPYGLGGGLGVWVGQSWVVVRRPPCPAGLRPPRSPFDFPQGERFPWSCACQSSRALGSTASPASPLWIPAFAGMTMVVCGPGLSRKAPTVRWGSRGSILGW